MKISEQFAGSYLKAQDLPQPEVLTIQDCSQAKMPEGDTKPALRFVGEQQQLVLNKTNAYSLAEWFGDDTNAWNGRAVELYSTTTSFGGRMVPAIRVRLPQQPQYQQPTAPQQQPMQYAQPAPQQQPLAPMPQYQPAREPQTPSPQDWPYFKQEASNIPQPRYRPATAQQPPQAPAQQWQVPAPPQPAPAADFFDGPVDA